MTTLPPLTKANLLHFRQALAAGVLSDAAFDQLLPSRSRLRSAEYWTPLRVAQRAAALFHDYGARRVLDVGSGAGKFCLAAAAAQSGLTLVGAERRAHLVETARGLARQLDVPNTSFLRRDAFYCSWRPFDGLYFFNPFWENLVADASKFDRSVELSKQRFLHELERADLALRGQRPGTILITYHGLGVPIPSSYDLVASEPTGNDHLRVWLRRRSCEQDWYHVEIEDSVCRMNARQFKATQKRWLSSASARPTDRPPYCRGADR